MLEKRLRVLVVEDDVLVADNCAAALRAAGMHVDVALCGIEALHKLFSDDFDVVVLDLELPDMNGLAVLLMLRQAGKNVAAIVSTVHTHLDVRTRAREIGISAFLPKPFNPTLLAERITILFDTETKGKPPQSFCLF